MTGGQRRPSSGPGRKSQSRNERRRAQVQQRRRAAAAKAAKAQTKHRRRRTAGIVGAAIVLLGAGLTTALVLRGGSGNGSEDVSLKSELVEDPTPNFAITSVPSAYSVVYRVDSYDSSGHVSTDTEQFQFRRPFDAAVEGKAGAPPGTTEQWKSISNLGLYSDTSSGNDPQVYRVLPQTALADLRLDSTLGDLVKEGIFTPREQRRVLGRQCQVYRTGAPLETFSVAKATATDYADACIDASGHLLEEVSVVSGKLGGRMVATSVTDKPTATDSAFKITGPPSSLADGGAELTSIDLDKAPAAHYWTMPTPAGYQHTGRYRLRQEQSPPSSDSTETPATTAAPTPPKILETYVDVYVKGNDVLVVQQGAKEAEQVPDASDPTKQTAPLGPLGTVELRTGLTGTQIAAHPSTPANSFVHVAGSAPLAQLKQVAATLRVS